MMHLEPWQWLLLILGAVLVGAAKTGLSGLGTLFIAIFASVIPTKQSTGLILPLLIFGDVIAVWSYRRHTHWPQLLRVFPWAAIGVIGGYFAMNHIDDGQARRLVGGIVVALVVLTLLRRRSSHRMEERWKQSGPPRLLSAGTGVLAGVTTLIANAAGPLMAIYLLALRLPKLEFLGTSSMFFLLLNLYKVPFMMHLGLVNGGSLTINLLLAPAVWVGGLAGRWLVHRINQQAFELMTLALTAAAGAKLLFF